MISVGGRLGYEDAGNTPNTQVVLHDYAAAPLIFETRGLPKSKAAQSRWDESMDNYRGSQIGVIVQCENGYVSSSSSYMTVEAFGPDGEQIEQWRGGGDHFRNFLDAVGSGRREDLNAEVLEGHLSSALCHTGNVSHRLGEQRTAAEIMRVGRPDIALLAESVDRMLAHLRANEVDVDRPDGDAWAVARDRPGERAIHQQRAGQPSGAARGPQAVRRAADCVTDRRSLAHVTSRGIDETTSCWPGRVFAVSLLATLTYHVC